MKVRLSTEAVYYLAEAFVNDLKRDVEEISGSSISLNDFEKKGNELIKKIVVAKDISRGFVEARKELK